MYVYLVWFEADGKEGRVLSVGRDPEHAVQSWLDGYELDPCKTYRVVVQRLQNGNTQKFDVRPKRTVNYEMELV